MSKQSTEKTPAWFYIALAIQTLLTILLIGLLKDLMWIY